MNENDSELQETSSGQQVNDPLNQFDRESGTLTFDNVLI